MGIYKIINNKYCVIDISTNREKVWRCSVDGTNIPVDVTPAGQWGGEWLS
jgi:hypothetical protein